MIPYELAAAAALAILQIALMAQLARAQRAMSQTGRRLDQLTSALELLTDTSETGFGHVAGELERLSGRLSGVPGGRVGAVRARAHAAPAPAGPAREDDQPSVELTENGVHLRLGDAEPAIAGPGSAPADAAAPGRSRHGDVDRWVFTMRRRRSPGREPRHAAVRV